MAIDPVCGMEANEQKGSPHNTVYMGETYYFCSENCKTTFKSNPEKYIEAQDRRTRDERKIVVVGAGQVGATFCFSLISGLASNIVLIDQNRDAALGHAMDLNHGLSFAQPARIYAGDYADCAGADIVVVTAGAPQKEGETRLDLVQKNTEIFKEIIPEISAHDPGMLLIVSNPVDILTYVALKVSGYPMNRVIGSGTSLDTARFRFLLSRHCRVDPRNVHAYIIGEHGDSEVPVWSQVNVAGLPIEEYCRVSKKSCSSKEKEDIFNQVIIWYLLKK